MLNLLGGAFLLCLLSLSSISQLISLPLSVTIAILDFLSDLSSPIAILINNSLFSLGHLLAILNESLSFHRCARAST